MRTEFITQLVKERKKNDRIFLIVGDLGYNVVNAFAEEFPNSYLNAGIAEQNMMGVAAGLAKEGYIVYVYSIGNFPTLRCLEQIRNDVAYNNLNVRIVSVGAGFAYGSLGASHHTTEDVAVLSTLPNMVVCSPGDPYEARRITALSVEHNGPMYIRLGKAGEKNVHLDSNLNFEIGDIVPIISGASSTAVIVTGSILYQIKKEIECKQLRFSLFSVPSLKPINLSNLQTIAENYSNICVVEEHQKIGGLGSIICANVSDMYDEGLISYFPHIKRIAIDDKFIYQSASQQTIRNMEGLYI